MEFSSILMLLFVSRFACAIYDDVLPHGHMARSEQSSVVLSGMKLNLLFGRQESCPAGEFACSDGGCCRVGFDCCPNTDFCCEAGSLCCDETCCDPDFGCGSEPGTCANSPPAETLTDTDVGFTSTSFFTITQDISTDVSVTQFFTTIETTNLFSTETTSFFSTETVLSSFSTETEASFSVPVASRSTSQALSTLLVPTASQPNSSRTPTASVTQSSSPVIATAGASSIEAAAVLPAWIASIWLVFAWV